VRNPNWTEKEDATALRLRAAGVDTEVIAERLRRTPDAVRRRLNWIKLSPVERAAVNAGRADRAHRLVAQLAARDRNRSRIKAIAGEAVRG
jgi:hypothetical protein